MGICIHTRVVMPNIMVGGAAMNALGCSGHTEGDKTYSTSDYTHKHCM